jgi:hypothetical protein
MPNYFLHLWAVPPENLELTCPAPPPGMQPDPVGFFAPDSVQAAFSWAGYISLGLVIALVLFTYLATSGSLSPRFVKRWWFFLLVSAFACFAIGAGALMLYPTQAMVNSCQTNPTDFARALPLGVVWNRAFAGLVWGALTFSLVSVLLTQLLGRWPWSQGLFHFRGCPVPRYRP